METFRVAILAGNKNQFVDWLDKNAFSEDDDFVKFIYIDNHQKLLGNRFDDYKIVGTFWERKDANLIEKLIHTRFRKNE